MDKVLVTGASGFVGRRLLARLAKESLLVRAQYRREPPPAADKSIEWRQTDLSLDDADLSALCTGCRYVIHLAAQVHDPKAGADVCDAVNHQATRRLAQAAADAGVERFVFLSTIGVYGRSRGEPVDRDSACQPHNAYARSKLDAEQALQAVCDDSAMRYTIVRAPLVYGPGVPANFLALLKLVRSGVPIPLGSVENARSFVQVDNLCDALVRAVPSPAAANQIYVIADVALSTPELVRRLAAAMDKPARLVPVPLSWLRWGGQLVGRSEMISSLTESLVVDDRHLRADLDWTPPVDAQAGLRETVAWFLRGRLRGQYT